MVVRVTTTVPADSPASPGFSGSVAVTVDESFEDSNNGNCSNTALEESQAVPSTLESSSSSLFKQIRIDTKQEQSNDFINPINGDYDDCRNIKIKDVNSICDVLEFTIPSET